MPGCRLPANLCRLCRLGSRVGSRLGFDVDLLHAADSVQELHPAEVTKGPPALALSGQYDRVRACPFGFDVAREISEAQGAPRSVGATTRYTLTNVFVCGNEIVRRGRRKMFNWELKANQPPEPWTELGEVMLRSSHVGCKFFGHWLRDDCATHLLAEQEGAPMHMPTPVWPDCAGYLHVFGQTSVELRRALVRRLVLFNDICQNGHKIARLRSLRARVAEKVTPQQPGRIVYMTRGATAKARVFANENEVVNALERRGVLVVHAETLNVPGLLSEMLGARIVISVEGSQLSHALYTIADNGGILTIQPPNRFFNSHMDWARPLGIQYSLVVGESRSNEFYLAPEDLLRTLDLLDANVR